MAVDTALSGLGNRSFDSDRLNPRNAHLRRFSHGGGDTQQNDKADKNTRHIRVERFHGDAFRLLRKQFILSFVPDAFMAMHTSVLGRIGTVYQSGVCTLSGKTRRTDQQILVAVQADVV